MFRYFRRCAICRKWRVKGYQLGAMELNRSLRVRVTHIAALSLLAAAVSLMVAYRSVSAAPISTFSLPLATALAARHIALAVQSVTSVLTERQGMSSAAAKVVAKAVFKVQSLGCMGTEPDYGAVRKQADSNWWGALSRFATADEVQEACISDPDHPHILIFVAPGWCHWSQQEVAELQKSFDDLGDAKERVHFIDVDNDKNVELTAFHGVASYPTIVIVQGDDTLMTIPGYKDFEFIRDLAQAETGPAPIPASPGTSPF